MERWQSGFQEKKIEEMKEKNDNGEESRLFFWSVQGYFICSPL